MLFTGKAGESQRAHWAVKAPIWSFDTPAAVP
jgi:hypothetical protein